MTEKIESFIERAIEEGWYFKAIINAANRMMDDPSFDPMKYLMNEAPTIPNWRA